MKQKNPKVVIDTRDNSTIVRYGERLLGMVLVTPEQKVIVSVFSGPSTSVRADYSVFQNRNEGIAYILDRSKQLLGRHAGRG